MNDENHEENYYDIERKRNLDYLKEIFQDCEIVSEAEDLSKFATKTQLELSSQTEYRQLCPGLCQPQGESYYDLQLNLFPEGLNPLKQLELLPKFLHEDKPSGRELRIRCDLNQDAVRSADHLAAYLQVAAKFPNVVLMLESVNLDDFLGILPAGQWYPSNVYVGTVAGNPEEWNTRIPVLDRVPCANRFVRLPNPVGMSSLRHWSQWNEMGTGIGWLIVELDPVLGLSEETARCVSLLHEQAKLWDIPLYLEGGTLIPNPGEEENPDEPWYKGPDGLQVPFPPWLRDYCRPDACAPNLNGFGCDMLKGKELETPMRDVYRVMCHAECSHHRPIHPPRIGGEE